ncbi:hypothetical protein QF042_003943 [Pedobacter sp. W3I1]|nr:hypothetical protein [Pedobacter sp. W3I1]
MVVMYTWIGRFCKTFILTPRSVSSQTETQTKLKVVCGDTDHGLERVTHKSVILFYLETDLIKYALASI